MKDTGKKQGAAGLANRAEARLARPAGYGCPIFPVGSTGLQPVA